MACVFALFYPFLEFKDTTCGYPHPQELEVSIDGGNCLQSEHTFAQLSIDSRIGTRNEKKVDTLY